MIGVSRTEKLEVQGYVKRTLKILEEVCRYDIIP